MHAVSTMSATDDPGPIAREVSSGITVLCDLDGTLIDTDYANYVAYRRAVREVTQLDHQIEFTRGERVNRETVASQLPSLTDVQLERIVALKMEYFREHLPDTKVNDELVDFLRRCKTTNMTVLVSTCREHRAIETLRYHGLLELFSQLLCREQLLVQPESINKYAGAMLLLGVEPNSVLVCEGEAEDIEKAVHAGIPRKNIVSVKWP